LRRTGLTEAPLRPFAPLGFEPATPVRCRLPTGERGRHEPEPRGPVPLGPFPSHAAYRKVM